MSLARLLAATTCPLLLILPARAVVLGVRQDLPEDREVLSRSLVLPPRPPQLPTTTVTTQLSVTITATNNNPNNPGQTALPTGSASDDSPAGGSPSTTAPSSGSPTDGTNPTGTGSKTLTTDMPTISGANPTVTNSSPGDGSSSGIDGGMGTNRNLVIILSTVLSVAGVLIIVAAVLICRRYRKGRFPFFTRGVSPIDDDEIATWKVPRNEKGLLPDDEAAGGGAVVAGAAAATMAGAGAVTRNSRDSGRGPSHGKHASTSSIKKPPSVIVYANPQGQGGYRRSSDDSSPRSFVSAMDSSVARSPGQKMSFDKILPQTPIQAKAPNARVGLTDESIPGDVPFIPSAKRQPSRLSKIPTGLSPSQRRHHVRTRSSRSSTRSFGDYAYSASDLGISARHSHDYVPRSYTHNAVNNWQAYSSASIPPRLSFSDESVINGNLSPRPLFDHEIGRAIG
jgi:hypothetical protein